MTPDIDPGFIADPENREALRERARNTSNVNPVSTTKLPVKSQAVDGPTADPRVQELHEADQAVVDPAPGPGTGVDVAETADSKSTGSSRGRRKASS